jgi:CheY-like chemotaxis protein
MSSVVKSTILLVDDKPESLIALEAVLGKQEYNLLFANSGAECIEIVMKNDVALVLLDIQMPGMDGYEAAKKIKQIEHCDDIPIIFITAIYKEEPYVKKGYEAGAIDYFCKPFDPDILRLKVKLYVAFKQKAYLLQERERRLKESEDLLQAGKKLSGILESLPVGVLIADTQGRICRTNEEVTRIWNAIEVGENDPLSRALGGQSSRNETFEIKSFDGAPKTIICSALPLLALDGHIVGAVVILQDVTEHKRIEEDLESRIRRLASLGMEFEQATHTPH